MSCILFQIAYEISKFGAPPWTHGGVDQGVDHGFPQHSRRMWLALSATSSSYGLCPPRRVMAHVPVWLQRRLLPGEFSPFYYPDMVVIIYSVQIPIYPPDGAIGLVITI